MPPDGVRRAEILDMAATLFASAGLRTSLKEIADACGILPGSLYHHFDSKEAIILELVRAFVDELDRTATIALDASRSTVAGEEVEKHIVKFGQAIAWCGVRHRAALLLTLYDPPSVLGNELVELAAQVPVAIEATMLELLRLGRSSGVVRPGIDLTLLADRLCQSMLHIGVGVSHMSSGAEEVPGLRLRISLHGLAVRAPSDAALDRSAAITAVQSVITGWAEEFDDDDRTGHLRAVARKEFGRRGYEATTMRDIASAAGLSTGTVYRAFASKDDLLFSIMHSYSEKVTDVWNAAIRAPSSPLERLDALMWGNIHVVDRFSDEFRIQLAWLRQSPPSTPDLGLSFMGQLRQIKSLLTEAAKTGEFRLDGSTADLRARCVYEAVMLPPSVIHFAGPRGAHALARDTVLRGALTRTVSGGGAGASSSAGS
jgi:AcrR family transcriptional regulator